MDKGVKAVELWFENCEAIELPWSAVSILRLSNIRITKNFEYTINVAEKAFLRITAEPFDMSLHGKTLWSPYALTGYIPIFARVLEYDDLVGIAIKYKDGSEKQYYVEYSGDEDNEWQYSRVAKDGSLFVLVGKGLKMEDYVSPELLIDMKKQRNLRSVLHESRFGGFDEESLNGWEEYSK